MSKSTGNRGTAFDQIDALDEAQTVAELVARIKPILYDLTYYAVNSETAVLDSHEEWRAGGANMLYDAMGAEHRAALLAQGSPMANPAVARVAQGDAAPPRKRAGKKPAQLARPPPSNRPRADDVSPALRAIMEGTHPTLLDDELPEGRWVRPG